MKPEHLIRLVQEIEQDASLDEPAQLQRRVEVLDRLEAYGFESSAELPELSHSEAGLWERIRAIQAGLEAANAEAYAAMRREIQQGRGRNSLLRWLPCLGDVSASLRLDNREGYDWLDEVIGGVFHFEEPGAASIEPTAEMVAYQPTPTRHIFDLLGRTALSETDVLVDIGSGLGHVPILTSIWTGARAFGIEVDPAYVACARRAAESLNLSRVTFVQQDARAADFSGGTVFYLYTPFKGAMLRTTLDLLRHEAGNRPIRVCTFGPCTTVIAAEDWLDAIGEARPDPISVFRSR
jgi:hypothetical protein